MKENKPVHELCVDKTSCKDELENRPVSPTANLTKDSIRKQYEAGQQKTKSAPQ